MKNNKNIIFIYLYSTKYYLNLCKEILATKKYTYLKNHIFILGLLIYIVFFLFTICAQILTHNVGNSSNTLQNIFILAFLVLYSIILTTNLDTSIIRGFIEANTSFKNRFKYLLVVESYVPFIIFILALFFQLPVIIGQACLNGWEGLLFNLHFTILLFILFSLITSVKVLIQSIKSIWVKYNLLIIREVLVFILSLAITLLFEKIVDLAFGIYEFYVKYNLIPKLSEVKFLNSISLYNYSYTRELAVILIVIFLLMICSYSLRLSDNTQIIVGKIMKPRTHVLTILFSRFGIFNNYFVSCIVFVNIFSLPLVKNIVSGNILFFISIISLSIFTRFIFSEFNNFIYINKLNSFKVSFYFSLMHIVCFVFVSIWILFFNIEIFSAIYFIFSITSISIIDLIYFFLISKFIRWIKNNDSISNAVNQRLINFASIIPFFIYSMVQGVIYVITLF